MTPDTSKLLVDNFDFTTAMSTKDMWKYAGFAQQFVIGLKTTNLVDADLKKRLLQHIINEHPQLIEHIKSMQKKIILIEIIRNFAKSEIEILSTDVELSDYTRGLLEGRTTSARYILKMLEGPL